MSEATKPGRLRLERQGDAFAVILAPWVFLTNNAAPGERRFWLRVGTWRKSFGPRRPA